MGASMDLVRPHCQPLHVYSSSDDSRLLTTLTTPRRAHPRCWKAVRPRTATSQRWEDAGVELQTERCMRVNWFWCGVVRQSVEKNKRCGLAGDGVALHSEAC